MGLGDEIMAAGQAEVMYRRDPSRPVAILDMRGQVRWHPIWDGNPAIATPEYVRSGKPYQRVTNGVGCRPYIRYPFTARLGIRVTNWQARDHIARICLTPEERRRGWQVREEVGPFVVIEPDVKPSTTPNKSWGVHRFAEVVEAVPDVTFLRVHGDECRPFAPVRNIHTRTFREACAVLAASDGYVGTEGGLHHAAAALRKPAVVIFGGFISPQTTGYDTHINLVDEGPGSPCGNWMPCAHCRDAMAKITVDSVVMAVLAMTQQTDASISVWQGAAHA